MNDALAISRNTKIALVEGASVAHEVNNEAAAELFMNLIPFKREFVKNILPSSVSGEELASYCGEIENFRDSKVVSQIGESGMKQFAEDPDGFCSALLTAFYTNHLSSILDEQEQEKLVAALLQAQKCGKYAKPKWDAAGFSPEWFQVLKPLLSAERFKVLMEGVAAHTPKTAS